MTLVVDELMSMENGWNDADKGTPQDLEHKPVPLLL